MEIPRLKSIKIEQAKTQKARKVCCQSTHKSRQKNLSLLLLRLPIIPSYFTRVGDSCPINGKYIYFETKSLSTNILVYDQLSRGGQTAQGNRRAKKICQVLAIRKFGQLRGKLGSSARIDRPK